MVGKIIVKNVYQLNEITLMKIFIKVIFIIYGLSPIRTENYRQVVKLSVTPAINVRVISIVPQARQKTPTIYSATLTGLGFSCVYQFWQHYLFFQNLRNFSRNIFLNFQVFRFSDFDYNCLEFELIKISDNIHQYIQEDMKQIFMLS